LRLTHLDEICGYTNVAKKAIVRTNSSIGVRYQVCIEA
jgi:hypothetical protein